MIKIMTNKIPSLVALKLISIHLADFKINHALGGSGLLYALGLIDEVTIGTLQQMPN